MSISNGFFTNSDGEIFKLSSVASVQPVVVDQAREWYEVIFTSGHHTTIDELYYPRDTFITQWQLV